MLVDIVCLYIRYNLHMMDEGFDKVENGHGLIILLNILLCFLKKEIWKLSSSKLTYFSISKFDYQILTRSDPII